jgi:hypothetical protein
VLISAAFGQQVGLSSFSAKVPENSGHSISLPVCLSTTLADIFIYALMPWPLSKIISALPIPYVSKRISMMNEAYRELKVYMFEMIESAKTWVQTTKSVLGVNGALLRNLVEANMKLKHDDKSLTDEEMLSDIFVRHGFHPIQYFC